jgi:hypothetical protein
MSQQSNQNESERGEITSLEDQLRGMPRAAAPKNLLERLLADVPLVVRPAPRPRPLRWLIPISAIAAVLCLVAAISLFNGRPVARSEFDVSANYVVYRPIHQLETDPCSILPPLPESLPL